MQIGIAFQCMIVLGKKAVFVVVYRGGGSAYGRGWMDLDSLWPGVPCARFLAYLQTDNYHMT